MIRGGTTTWRIARLLACATAIATVTAPAAAHAQPAVDEYTLDIPSGGGSDPSGAASGGEGSGAATGAAPAGGAAPAPTDTGSDSGAAKPDVETGTAKPDEDSGGKKAEPREGESPGTAGFHDRDEASRPATEVVADSLFDTAMLPVLAALVVITGIGVWRVLRGRRTLTGHTG